MAGSSNPLHINSLNGQNGARSGSAESSPPRRSSSPLMPPFMVSAPGKVIVYGEHAVVHGKVRSALTVEFSDLSQAAIAAAISLRSYLLVSFLSKSKRTVTL